MNRPSKAKSIFTRIAPLGVGVLLLLHCSLLAQSNTYSLIGTATAKDGEAYPYHVFFTIIGNTLYGYSITRQPTGADFKAQVSGHIDRRQHTLTITETKSLDKLPQGQVICLFDTKLTYKIVGNKYIATGTFIGNDNTNTICGGGTMEFEQPNAPGSVFYVAKKAPPLPAPKPITDTPATAEPPMPPNTITEGIQKQLDWISDTCILEVWDGGVIDGDVVTILFNEAPLLTNYTLEKTHKQLHIPLTKKKNTITIIADDEGANPPNTADVLLIDGSAYYKITAYNKQGKKSMIVLTKK